MKSLLPALKPKTRQILILGVFVISFAIIGAWMRIAAQPVSASPVSAPNIKMEADYILACQYNHPADPAHGAINDVFGDPTWVVPRENGNAILGLILASELLDDPSYFERAQWAADYLIGVQDTDGAWYNQYHGITPGASDPDDLEALAKSPTQTAEVMMALYHLGYQETRYEAMKKGAEYLMSCQNPANKGGADDGLLGGGKDSGGNYYHWRWTHDNAYAYWAFKAGESWAIRHHDLPFAAQCAESAKNVLDGINASLYDSTTGVWRIAIDENGGAQSIPNLNGLPSWIQYAPQMLDLPAQGVNSPAIGEWIHDQFQQADGSCIGYDWGDSRVWSKKYPGLCFQAALAWFDTGHTDYANAAIQWAETSGLWQTTPDSKGIRGGWVDWVELASSNPAKAPEWQRFIDTSFYAIAAWNGGYDFKIGIKHGEGVYFDDSDANIMTLGSSPYYEVGLLKSNGSIAYITDLSTGEQISYGSRQESLWGAMFRKSDGALDWVGGAMYTLGGSSPFSYTWSGVSQTLTLNYIPDPEASQKVSATVTVSASPNTWFDIHLRLDHQHGGVLEKALFPSELVFKEDEIQEALLPILPGVALEPDFFTQHHSYTAKYPGNPGMFADYMALSSMKGHLAIYSLSEGGPVRPAEMGFVHDDLYINASTYFYHAFAAGQPGGQVWTSPGIRIRVTQPPTETIQAFRSDNGLDEFPSLHEKLGARYTQVAQSPLYKADVDQLSIQFSQYPAEILSKLPSPGILHLVSYWPGGFDQNYPDFLPPDPARGNTADLAAMIAQAKEAGLLVMPYTNPTWWAPQSPTLAHLPPTVTITDVAAIDLDGKLIAETYNGQPGYVVSPYSPFVQQRLSDLNISMTTEMASDLIFEDQIGARAWLYDLNGYTPGATAYMQGWLEHTQTYSASLLMTEAGYDRLAESEIGFHGSVLWKALTDDLKDLNDTDLWHPYPLAAMIARDKVLFYQHDLFPQTMTHKKSMLAWNLAFGYMLSYNLVEEGNGGGLDDRAWLEVVGAFQKNGLARYAAERVTDFSYLDDQASRTTFENFAVTANWDVTDTYTVGAYTLPPSGVIITSTDGSLIAGVFTSYNLVPLSQGDHYLIEERAANEITVRQPMGTDTALTLHALPGWASADSLQVCAYENAAQPIECAPAAVTSQNVTFTYRQEIGEKAVAYYKIFPQEEDTAKVYLPFVMR